MYRLGLCNSHTFLSKDIPLALVPHHRKVHYISLESSVARKGYKLHVRSFNSKTGELKSSYKLDTQSQIYSPHDVLPLRHLASSPVIAWVEGTRKVHTSIIGHKNVHSFQIENPTGEEIINVQAHSGYVPSGSADFLVSYETNSHSWAEVYRVGLKDDSVSRIYGLSALPEKASYAAATEGHKAYFTRLTRGDVTLFSSSAEELARFPVEARSDHSLTLSTIPQVITHPNAGYEVNIVELLDSGDWSFIHNGHQAWLRSESLVHPIAATWVDDDAKEHLAQELEAEGHDDIYHAYKHRVLRHLAALRQELLPWIRKIPIRMAQSVVNLTNLAQFGIDRKVIVATRHGRVAVLDPSKHGEVIWNVKVSEKPWEVQTIRCEHGIATLHVADGSVARIDTLSGAVIEHSRPTAMESGSVILLPSETDTSSSAPISSSHIPVRVLVDGTPTFPTLERPRETFVVTFADGRLRGWNALTPEIPVWEFRPPPGQRTISAVSRPAHDPTASIGKVLGNRQVMYKYLNPNIILVASVNDQLAVLTVYLLDGVSGRVLHTVAHGGVDSTKPISLVLSQNWFVYTFFADINDSKGYQLVVSEAYESRTPDDRGPLKKAANFSSLQPDGLYEAYVISQAYFVDEAMPTMAVTQTRGGITNREVVVYLPESRSIAAIPRPVLDPRRPVGGQVTPEQAEEGLMPYLAYLDIGGFWYLSHARDVGNITRIQTRGTDLESNSLIFAFGPLDIFGTRVAPSQEFDVLGKSFDKPQLLMTLVALMVAVLAMEPWVKQKQVNFLWKS